MTNKVMNKKTIMLISVLISAAMFSGCGAENAATTAPSEQDAATQNAIAELLPESSPAGSSRVMQIERSDTVPEAPTPVPTGTTYIPEPRTDLDDTDDDADTELPTKDTTPTPTPTPTDEDTEEKDPNKTGNGTPLVFSVGDCTCIALGSIDKTMATEILTAVNAYRTRGNLPPLEANMSLEFCADVRSKESTVCFNHTRPNGMMWYTVAPAYYKAELLAKDYGTAQDTVDAWMSTATGRQYLLDPDLLSVGISVFHHDGRNFCVAGLGD